MKKLSEMTLKEKLGQLVMCGFEDDYYDDHLKTLVEEYKVANVIYFARNVKNIRQLAELNKKVYSEIIRHTGTIPFVGIDQEGGMVTRIMDGATFAPGSMTISATNNPNNAYKIGEIMGKELAVLGINLNLAPSLDVNNNPANPVIGVRSYSDDPEMVGIYGNGYIKGLQSQGVLATAKHFPGHGDTNVDSHLGLPRISHSLEHINATELVPFKLAINEGVKAIMSAHIIYDVYDIVPCTLSKKVLTDVLRGELGFKGLVVSDCMQMKAIDTLYTTEKGVVMGIEAGLDIACISHSLERQVGALKLLEEAVLNGSISESLIDEKVERILAEKEKIEKAMITNFVNRSLDDIEAFFNGNEVEENKKFAKKVVEESITIVKGKRFVLDDKKTLVIGTSPYATTIAEDRVNPRSIIDNIKAEIPSIDCITIASNPENVSEVIDIAKSYEKIVFLTYNVNSFAKQMELLKGVIGLNKDLYVFATRNPYDYINIKDVKNFACMYEYTPSSVSSVVKYLKGEIGAKGKLPVELEKRLPIGASLYLGLDDYSLEDNLAYLDLLKEKKIDIVFISAHMMEAGESFDREFKCILDKAKKNNMKIVVDVNKKRLEEMEAKGQADGVFAFRLDYGFSKQDMLALMEKPYKIELNASMFSKSLIDTLDYLKENNADLSRIRISHNFFPKPYTGLSYEDVKAKNDLFHKYGLKVSVFIPSQKNHRPPMYEGLPTIEDQRYQDLTATLSECVLVGADMVQFGDAILDSSELDEALNYTYDVLPIPIKLNYKASDKELESLRKIHSNRIDASPYMIRSSVRNSGIEPKNCVERHKGDVTVDNDLNKRYSGEVGIALKDMRAEDGVNVVGKCLCNEYLIDNIKPGQKFRFVIKK